MNELGWNPEKMEREAYCFGCKEYSIITTLAPQCPKCKRNLITVIRDVITGERITGKEPALFPIWQEVKNG